MAVKIDIPEIGTIVAENAATEQTLLDILAALDKDSAKNKQFEDRRKKADEEATGAAKAKAKADADAAKVGKEFSTGWSAVGAAAVKGLKDIGLTAVSMATKFGTDFVNIAENPIKETAKMLDALIDVGSNVVSSFAEAIPIIGAFISAATKAAAELAKAANKAFAEQLQRNVDALQSYAKIGVSFSGSMTQMSTVAHAAGLGIADFSKVVANNRDVLRELGMAGGDAATRLSGAMGSAATTVRKSGMSLRDEMFKMGYTYEEQGAVFTSFMANMQMAGRLRSMTDQQVAEQTRKYATDLKVISDITGQDAKKLAEKSRAEAMRGALLASLQGDQVTAFQRANEVLSKAPKEVQDGLTQYLTFGTITDPKLLANREMADMVRTIGDQVKAGNQDMISVTTREMAGAAQRMQSEQGKMFGQAVDRALVAGVSGAGAEAAQLRNQFLAMNYALDPEAADKSRKANEDQATITDQLADETAKLYAQTKQYQVEMEDIVQKHLPKYAELLKETNELLQGNFMKFIKSLGDSEVAKAAKEKNQKYMEGIAKTQQGMGQENLQRMAFETEDDYRKRMIELAKRTGNARFDSGGKIGSGQTGLVGEYGPEFVSGPASVLSRVDTEKLVVALDAMREMAGVRFSENDFNWQVGMQADRMSTLQDRMRGFEGYDYSQLQSELSRRGEYSGMQAAKDQMDKEERESTAETVSQLAELVRLMKENVNHTARVAVNTN